jgi:SAM-dependent methyltransferase
LGENRKYTPSGWLRLRVALPKREVTADDVFVDVGSGKGRVVVQAAVHYPFKRVIGVELVEDFTEIARKNVERNRARLRAGDVELVTADALRWELPDDLTIVYMYNPIVGGLFMRFIERLIAFVDQRQRGLRLIYVNPTQHEQLLATGRVTELPPPRGLLARIRGVPPSELRRYEIRP